METNKYQQIISNAPFGYAYLKILYDKDEKPVDFLLLEVNKGFEDLTHIKANKVTNKKLSDIFPDIKGHAFERVYFHVNNAITGQVKELEKFFPSLKRWYKIHVQSDKPGYFTTIFSDITNRHLISESLAKFNQFSFENIDYKYISDIMLKISEAKFVALNIFSDCQHDFITASVSGLSQNILQANKILGFNLENKKWSFDPNEVNKIKANKTTCFSNFNEYSNNIIPKNITQLIQTTFNIGYSYIVKITKNESILGDFIIIYEKGKEINDKAIIENFADSVGILLSRIEAERELFHNKEKFKKLTENISDVLWTSDLNLNITYVSPSIYRLLGYTPEEYQKLSIEERHPLLFVEYFSSVIAEDLELESDPKSDPNRSQILQAEAFHKNGSVLWVEMNVSYLRNELGKAIGFQGVSRDITKLKLANDTIRNKEEQYRLIFENSPVGILHFDNDGIIVECNDSFVNIIGSSKDKLVGLDMTKLPDDNIVKSIKKVNKGESAYYEGNYTSVTANKTTPIRALFSPINKADGVPTGGVGIIEDRTAFIQQEKLEKQVAVAKESVKFKQNFLANMSHEIRTPLTGIMGMIEILEQTPLNDHQLEYLNNLKHTGENLMEIINQVLDYSKIEAGKAKLNLKLTNIGLMLKNAEKFFNSINNKPIFIDTYVDPAIPEFIKADVFRINQVINNLISNAVKFTSKGKITIKAELLKDIEKRLNNKNLSDSKLTIKISVTDTGLGISKENIKALFTPFAQLEIADNRMYEGSGLGLSICKQIIEMHEGNIGVRSKPDKGSTFWFSFKAEKVEAKKQTNNQEPSETSIFSKKGLRILLAEDKKVSQKVIMLMLVKMGHKVMIAENGQEVLDMFDPDKYDLILMDIQMPEMDGITATKKLKEKYSNLPPIVGLSANAFEGDKEKYMSMGMDEYITKPLKSTDIDELVNRLFDSDWNTLRHKEF